MVYSMTNYSPMRTELEFEKFYQSILLGDLHQLEIKRLNVTGKLRLLLFFELIIFIGIIIFLFWFPPEGKDIIRGIDPGKIFWIIFSRHYTRDHIRCWNHQDFLKNSEKNLRRL